MTQFRISSLLVVGSSFSTICWSRLFVSFIFLSSPGRGLARFRACYDMKVCRRQKYLRYIPGPKIVSKNHALYLILKLIEYTF